MKHLHEKRTLSHPMRKIFDLVLDIASYPEFLPWITDSTIITTKSQHILADLTVSFASIKQCYRSNVTYEITDHKAYIESQSHTGPFSHLLSRWDFTKDGNNTIVEFTLEFELKSKIMTSLVGPVILETQKKIITAFEERLRVILGNR